MIISIFRGRLWHKERVTQFHHGTRHSLGTAPSQDCSQHAGTWETILVFPLPRSQPLRSLAASSSKREWVRARNQIGTSESQGSVLTAHLFLTVIVGLRGVPLGK